MMLSQNMLVTMPPVHGDELMNIINLCDDNDKKMLGIHRQLCIQRDEMTILNNNVESNFYILMITCNLWHEEV